MEYKIFILCFCGEGRRGGRGGWKIKIRSWGVLNIPNRVYWSPTFFKRFGFRIKNFLFKGFSMEIWLRKKKYLEDWLLCRWIFMLFNYKKKINKIALSQVEIRFRNGKLEGKRASIGLRLRENAVEVKDLSKINILFFGRIKYWERNSFDFQKKKKKIKQYAKKKKKLANGLNFSVFFRRFASRLVYCHDSNEYLSPAFSPPESLLNPPPDWAFGWPPLIHSPFRKPRIKTKYKSWKVHCFLLMM